VPRALYDLCQAVFDGFDLPHRPDLGDPLGIEMVAMLCGWLHGQLPALIGRDDAAELFAELAQLHDQLRTAAGDPRAKPVANCSGWVRDPHTREKVECGAPLFLPPPQPGVERGLARPPKVDPTKPVMRCRGCDRPYTHLQLLRLEIGAERATG
jgi:hypothetical protein